MAVLTLVQPSYSQPADIQQQLDELRDRLDAVQMDTEGMRDELDALKAEDLDWLTEERADEIRGLVQDVLADADARNSLVGDGLLGGWSDGFFLASSDGQRCAKGPGTAATNPAGGRTQHSALSQFVSRRICFCGLVPRAGCSVQNMPRDCA